MSRYFILAVHEHYVVALGYDPLLGTFFAQVSNNTPTSHDEYDESPLALWVGADIHEITTVDALQEHIKDYAQIPDEMRRRLEQDARDIGFRPNFGTALAQTLSERRTLSEEVEYTSPPSADGSPTGHQRRPKNSEVKP